MQSTDNRVVYLDDWNGRVGKHIRGVLWRVWCRSQKLERKNVISFACRKNYVCQTCGLEEREKRKVTIRLAKCDRIDFQLISKEHRWSLQNMKGDPSNFNGCHSGSICR